MPESPYEKQLVIPRAGNSNPRDLAWAEARYAADLAAEQALFLAMSMPTETAPERKGEAQRLHERALKLYQRVEALGPAGLGDLLGFASDVRATLQPILDFEESCGRDQAEGTLQSLAWPSYFDHAQRALAQVLDRMDAIVAGKPAPSSAAILRDGCPAIAENLGFTAHLLDPLEREAIAKALQISERLLDVQGQSAEQAVEEAVDFQTEVARGVESGRLRNALNPILADHMRREAVLVLEGLRRAALQENA